LKIIGIDPGITGAIAIIDDDGVSVVDTPTIEVQKGGKGKMSKTEFLPSEMAEILREAGPGHIFIEAVHAMPGQGVTSMFGFGVGYGVWLGIIAALNLPHTKVTPQAWKKEIMKGMPDKDASRIRAQEMFPELTGLLARKKDHGRADALLIAAYGKSVIK
jgi:crossover junction endodeoxyribonuclease RuvC